MNEPFRAAGFSLRGAPCDLKVAAPGVNPCALPRGFVASLVALAWCAAGGCQYAPNPFVDETHPASAITTSTADGVMATSAGPIIREKDWEPVSKVYPVSGVNHWPLWWEDPFEDKGSDDGRYAWTGEDWLAMPYGWARWLLNTLSWPVSAAVTPPGTVMSSDGRVSRQGLGYDHDARRGPTSSTESPPPLEQDRP